MVVGKISFEDRFCASRKSGAVGGGGGLGTGCGTHGGCFGWP